MSLQVIGAGLPRTGTKSLKAALEQLLGEPCYHMFEVFDRPDDRVWWSKALDGDASALSRVLDGYGAAIDWPAACFWRELREMYPDALVVLSHRGDAATWWGSVDRTVWAGMRRPEIEPSIAVFDDKMRRKAGFGDDWDVSSAAQARYQSLYNEVVATVPADRLLPWQPGDGWEPLCTTLGLPVPDVEFPHLNTGAEFRERANLDLQ